MTLETARIVVLKAWNGGRRMADASFVEACEMLGISRDNLSRLKCEARACEGVLPRHVVLTPMSAGKRR